MPLSNFWFAAPAAVIVNPISLSATASVGDVGGSNVDRVNDGSDSPVFSTASAPSDSQGIAVLDFGAAQTVAGFICVGTTDDHVDGTTMRMEWSTDNSNWTTFGNSWLINPGNDPHTETQTPTAVTKRYYRLTANQNFAGSASVGEIKLYATTAQMPS